MYCDQRPCRDDHVEQSAPSAQIEAAQPSMRSEEGFEGGSTGL
jgi:hypothetical protein